jgi:hypothetical protein
VLVNHPEELNWHGDPLPDVHAVAYNCSIVAWFVIETTQEERDQVNRSNWGKDFPPNDTFYRIECIHPFEDSLNPLRWCDSERMPIEGGHEKIKYWAWLNKGTPKEMMPWST